MVKVLSFDPSGNFKEGKGTSGYCLSLDKHLPHKLGDIRAEDYNSKHAYWFAHKELIEKEFPDYVVIESYRLFGDKSKEQIGSSLETPQLIGYLEMICFEMNIPHYLQDPTTKSRHNDAVLTKSGIIHKTGTRYYYKGELTNLHQRDAMRHDMYFRKYNMKKVVK